MHKFDRRVLYETQFRPIWGCSAPIHSFIKTNVRADRQGRWVCIALAVLAVLTSCKNSDR